MKLSFSTLGCPGWSWDEIFATAKDLSVKGIEIRGIGNEMYAPAIKEFDANHAPATMERLRKADMEIPILTSGACLGLAGKTDVHIQEALDYIALAARLGVKFVRVLITPVPQPGEADLVQAKALYVKLCDEAKEHGVTVLIETNGPLADSTVMRRFMEDTDPAAAGVLWDIHHPYRYFGETPQQTYANIGKWVRYVHVKDSVMEEGQTVYRMMGYGDVPVLDTLKVLHKNGYDGYVSLEWVKRWCPDLQEPGIVFSHYVNYMNLLEKQL